MAVLGPDIMYVPTGSVSPGAGLSLGHIASAGSGIRVGNAGEVGGVQNNAPFGWGHPLLIGAVLLGLLILSSMVIERSLRPNVQFHNIKVSAYNGLATTAMVVPVLYALHLTGFWANQKKPGNPYSAFTAGI